MKKEEEEEKMEKEEEKKVDREEEKRKYEIEKTSFHRSRMKVNH